MDGMKSNHGSAQPLDSRQLRAFVTLAKTGSFTRAGKELFISQSAVSHSMKALESDIGCRLFDRLGKSVQLTPGGEHLLHHAEKILREMTVARESIEQRSRWGQGRLRVGASLTICQYILPAVLSQLKKDFPQTLINVEACDTRQAFELLEQDRIDMAIVVEPSLKHEHDFEPMLSDELAFIVAADHPWTKIASVPRSQIGEQHFVLYSRQSQTFQMIEDYFRREEISLKTVVELSSMEAIKEFVKLGLGVSILAPWIAREEIRAQQLVALPLGKRKLKRTWGVLGLRSRSRNLIEETFLRLCRASCENLFCGEPAGETSPT